MENGHDSELFDLSVRLEIEAVFLRERRWMGIYLVRHQGDMGWCPMPAYVRVFNAMVRAGLLIVTCGKGEQFARYLLARLTFPGLEH